jgi:hypothetical protein
MEKNRNGKEEEISMKIMFFTVLINLTPFQPGSFFFLRGMKRSYYMSLA